MKSATVHLVGVRLRAGGAWTFLGIPLREFTDQVVELDATRFVKRGMTIRDLICWIVAWVAGLLRKRAWRF